MIPTSWRHPLGFAIAPAGGVAVVAVWLHLDEWPDGELLGFLFWVALAAYIAEGVIALPMHFLLVRRGVTTWLAYAGLGAVTGFAPFAGLTALGFEFARWIWIATAAGTVSASLFWVLVVREREPLA